MQFVEFENATIDTQLNLNISSAKIGCVYGDYLHFRPSYYYLERY